MSRLKPEASEAERIIAAAVLFTEKGCSYPRMFTGKRHSGCFSVMRDLGIVYDRASCRQGFFTSWSRFVDRDEAVDIARNAGQINPDFTREILISEDLW